MHDFILTQPCLQMRKRGAERVGLPAGYAPRLPPEPGAKLQLWVSCGVWPPLYGRWSAGGIAHRGDLLARLFLGLPSPFPTLSGQPPWSSGEGATREGGGVPAGPEARSLLGPWSQSAQPAGRFGNRYPGGQTKLWCVAGRLFCLIC